MINFDKVHMHPNYCIMFSRIRGITISIIVFIETEMGHCSDKHHVVRLKVVDLSSGVKGSIRGESTGEGGGGYMPPIICPKRMREEKKEERRRK